MNKKSKIFKILSVVVIIFFITNIFNQVYALDNLDAYKPPSHTEDPTVINMANKIIGGFKAIGSIVSVIALIVIGLRYMMSSVEERAANKESFIIYFIGAILVFGISNIAQVIYNWAITLSA